MLATTEASREILLAFSAARHAPNRTDLYRGGLVGQSAFDFTVPPVNPQAESWGSPPIAPGSHSSYTGSRQAVKTWGWKTSQILQLLAGGPKSRQELEGLTGIHINAICSVVRGLVKRGIVEVDRDNWDVAEWADGDTTKRERLKIRRR